MATNDLTNKYFIKNALADTYVDFATLFDGLRILRIDGFLAQGQSKNVYTASWEYEDEEDFAIVMQDDSDAPRIIHESADINITFIIRQKYATGAIDVHTQHKKFIEYMTEKDVWIKNSYNNNLVAHCVCLKEYSPTTEKYQRGSDSWVMGTITLHKLTSKLYYEFALTASLIGCTSDLPPVITNEKLFATITPLAGHQQLPWNTKVTMGGVDITSSVYDKATGQVSIPNVTGDITIEAEAVMMPSEYEPVEYVEMLNARRIAYPTSYKPNNHTQMEIVCELPATTARLLFGLNGYTPNTTPSTSNPAYWMWIRYTSGYTWMYNRTSRNNVTSYTIKTGEKIIVKIDEGVLMFPDHEDIQRTINSHVDDDFVTSQTMMLFGQSTAVNSTYTGCGKLWRWKVSEQDVLLLDWVPVRRKSDSLVGLYDVHTQAVLQIKDAACSIAPNITTTRHYTGCTASRLSAAITGTATQAVIGSTWQIKITPSSGYTFTGGTTPQVQIDGIDVTSQVVSDNGDGTYNVTIANVEDKPIEITARCSEIINVQGSQTYTPSVTVGTAYTAILTPGTGYQMLPWNTVVMDNGVDVTASAYNKSTNIISIDSVAGEVIITAESVEMGDEYEPVEYIFMISQSTSARLLVGYPATHNTEFEFWMSSASGGCLISHAGHNTTGSGVTTPDFVCRTNYTSSDTGFNIKRGNTTFSSNVAPGGHGAWTIPSTHCIVIIGKTISISTNGREPYSIDDGTEFVTPKDVILLGSANNTSGNHTGRHDRIIHRESGVVMNDYVPVLIKATGYVGWYDVINQELKGNYAPSLWLKPNVYTTRHYTGCSATRLSSAETGTAAYAVIGSTWSIKITPSRGYTFTGGTTPQVLIDGVDITSQVVTDNGDGTYNVTIANVEDKPIEINAVAVSDGTANATNSVTPMGGNTENNEEEM